ncbi:MAG TPA: J domain-containing protein [Pseudorhodoferax sp.]|nr:J domain-containing protein [Pseudorhodoferax sp.]
MSALVPPADLAHPPLQAEFQRLTDAITAQRNALAQSQLAHSDWQQQLATATAPQLARLRAIDRQLLLLLDHAADHAALGRNDLAVLHALARDLAAHLLRGGDDAEVQALYRRCADAPDDNRHAQDDQDDQGAETQAGAAPAADEDWQAQWERMEHAQAEAAQQHQRQRDKQKAQARRQRRTAAPAPSAEEGSQTLRAVYRKLASALHPDREADPVERARKTALMQRVNAAYAAQNLLDLLQLQLETAQIGPQAVAAMGEDALRRYNAVLAEQLAELRQETADTERAYRQALGLGHGAVPTPARAARAVKEQVRALQQDIAYYEWELRELQDPRLFKQWLREQR